MPEALAAIEDKNKMFAPDVVLLNRASRIQEEASRSSNRNCQILPEVLIRMFDMPARIVVA